MSALCRSNWAAWARFWVARTLPGVILERPSSFFEVETVVFSTLLRARARARRTCCDAAETPLKMMFRAHQSSRATKRGGRKIAQSSLCEPFGKLVRQGRAKNSFRAVSERLLERLWGSPGTLLDGSWPLLTRPGRPQIGLGAPFGRPQAVLSASGRVPETTLGLRTSPTSIFHRFFPDFGFASSIFKRFFVDFRSSRLRRSNKIRISKRSRAILTTRLGSCVVHSLRTARTSFAMTFEHYMFSLSSLRTHKLT